VVNEQVVSFVVSFTPVAVVHAYSSSSCDLECVVDFGRVTFLLKKRAGHHGTIDYDEDA